MHRQATASVRPCRFRACSRETYFRDHATLPHGEGRCSRAAGRARSRYGTTVDSSAISPSMTTATRISILMRRGERSCQRASA